MKEMKDQWTIDVLLFNKQLGQLDRIFIKNQVGRKLFSSIKLLFSKTWLNYNLIIS